MNNTFKLLDLIVKVGILCGVLIASDRLNKISKDVLFTASSIRSQTGQMDWLVRHYAKPVRPLYPWEKHKCEWCGSEILEGDDKIYQGENNE